MPTLSFWLSNTAVLLFVLGDDITKKEGLNIANIATGLKIFDTLTGSQDPSQHLKFLFVRIYCMVLDNLYRSLKPLAMSSLEQGRKTKKMFFDSFLGDPGMKHMKHIVSYLSYIMTIFQQYFVPVKLVRAIYQQIFMYLDAALFNEIILRRDLCTWSQGMELKMKVSLLDDWVRVCFK
jgi:myosin-5